MATEVQTSYPETPEAGYRGMIAQSYTKKQIDTFAIEDSGGIEYGIAVNRGTNPEKQVTAFSDTASEVFAGVIIAQRGDNESDRLTGQTGYPQSDAVPVMRRGRVYVVAGAALNAGDRIYPNADGTKWTTAATTNVSVEAFAVTSASGDDALFVAEISDPTPE